MNTDPSSKLSTGKKVDILQNLSHWLKDTFQYDLSTFSIIFTGGEPFLYPDQVFQLAQTCRTIGFKSYINTNGVLIQPLITQIVDSGLNCVTFSIDSHNARVHNNLRGESRVFETALDNLKRLLSERDNLNPNQKIYVQSILGNWNADVINEHVKFFSKLGVDGISFQCIQYPFGLPTPSNWQLNFEYYPSQDSVKRASKTIKAMKSQGYKITNSLDEISWWDIYFKHPEYLPPEYDICRAAHQNIIIDVLGNVKFCFNKELDPLNRIGNLSTNMLDEIWGSETAQEIRNEMIQCRRSCGLMLCHSDSNLRER
jgi:sulfatase maturation enzyme AslB (radical SAM superfamily)